MLEECNETVFSPSLNNSADGPLGIGLNSKAVKTQRFLFSYAITLA
jgi:hypothetical protein